MRVFRRSARPLFKRPLPADPPTDAKLYDWEDVPIAIFKDGSIVAYDPNPRPMPGRCALMAYPRPREEWDELRLERAEREAVGALGGNAWYVWQEALRDRLEEYLVTREDPGPPFVPVWMDQALPDWVRRRRLDA